MSDANGATETGNVNSKRRLVFDRRYGWVYDEWKHPSEEALSGGRGMFCILPLSSFLLKAASSSIDSIVSSAVRLSRRSDAQVVHYSLENHFHGMKAPAEDFMSSLSQWKNKPLNKWNDS